MNKANLNELADLLDDLPEPEFDIQDWTHECGAPACVVGHATTLESWQAKGRLWFGDPVFDGCFGVEGFARWAGINWGVARTISAAGVAGAACRFYAVEHLGLITPKIAAAALRRYIAS